MDIVIRPDPEYRKRILVEQRAKSGMGRRRGIHVSDLIFCVRKAWAEKQLEFVEDVSDETILLWARGLSHEDLISDGTPQVRAGYCFRCTRLYPYGTEAMMSEDSRCPTCQDTLLVGTIDWVLLESSDGSETLDDYVPVEMKSTLKSSRKTLAEMPWYADQLKTYMAMHDRGVGRIAILHIMGDYTRESSDLRGSGPKPQLNVYEVTWERDGSAAEWLEEMELRKNLVEGNTMPALDGVRSPAHSYICDYCDVGERLPNGEQCALWPWVRQPSGVYTRKGSGMQDMSMEDMFSELESMVKKADDDLLGGLTNE